MQLQQLVQQGKVWQAGRAPVVQESRISSGYPQLDQYLEGGWPEGCLTELLCDRPGQGELSLLLPLLQQLQEDSPEHSILLVDPPLLPSGSALAGLGLKLPQLITVQTRSRRDQLWSLEQALRSGCCPAVLAWLPQADAKALRRLQVAAVEGNSRGFLFRPTDCVTESSAAPWRFTLQRQSEGVEISLIKRKGGWPLPARTLSLAPHPLLPTPTAVTPAGRPTLRLVN